MVNNENQSGDLVDFSWGEHEETDENTDRKQFNQSILGKSNKRKPGPRVFHPKIRVTFNVEVRLKELLDYACENEGVQKSDFVRRAIEKELNRLNYNLKYN